MTESSSSPAGTTQRTIPVTIEKSHLLTIGEKLYTEKSSFLRELVNNAYDADATRVDVTITPEAIIIEDDGSGMNEEGLKQYFTIGSSLKKEETKSPAFGRTRIGEFGIGKFAALAAAECFEIETWKNDFHARLIFDKTDWSAHDDWHLDLQMLPSDKKLHGARITLRKPSVSFALGKIRRYLAERTPIHVSTFAVFLNQERVNDDLMTGERLPVHLELPMGTIDGTIVIAPNERRGGPFGLAVRVKGVLIRYESFGMELSRKAGVQRITGAVQADFLPVTSSRDNFLLDTPEYTAFYEAMRKECLRACGRIKEETDKRADLQSSRILKDALQKIGRAMRRHGRLFPDAVVPLGTPSAQASSEGFDITQAEFLPSQEDLNPELLERLEKTQTEKGKHGRPHIILGKRSVIRTLQIGSAAIAVRLEHLGNEDASLISGGIIYINVDHPLYRLNLQKDDVLTLHVARVITKELALRAGITDASQAFSLQDDLLTEALRK